MKSIGSVRREEGANEERSIRMQCVPFEIGFSKF